MHKSDASTPAGRTGSLERTSSPRLYSQPGGAPMQEGRSEEEFCRPSALPRSQINPVAQMQRLAASAICHAVATWAVEVRPVPRIAAWMQA